MNITCILQPVSSISLGSFPLLVDQPTTAYLFFVLSINVGHLVRPCPIPFLREANLFPEPAFSPCAFSLLQEVPRACLSSWPFAQDGPLTLEESGLRLLCR